MSGTVIRDRLNAHLLRSFDELAHQMFGRRKQALFNDLPDSVVEVGAGSGPNFRYYRPGTTVFAIEPNSHLHQSLRSSAERFHIDLSIIDGAAERLPLPDASTDAVICTLVLCTVPDQAAAIAEILRVLRPGGRLIFLEHVRAPQHTLGRWLQVLLHRPWRWLFEGCDLLRDTEAALRAAGFSCVDIKRHVGRTPAAMVNCQISGSVRR
ncbi:MAG TPA: class I SAM-dependent methyltransferase [Streptosporangiaceae bacterium]|nr:class I SAM-dependent methyltransferase [Streptosporangiaceae bacterium]